MTEKTPDQNVSRRRFLAGAFAVAAAPACSNAQDAAPGQPSGSPPASAAALETSPAPTRPLGRSGMDIPMISIGGAMPRHSPEYLEAAWDRGVRYFDTAHLYDSYTANRKSEENIGEFFRRHPGRREDVFLVSKSYFKGGQPEHLLADIDVRLRRCNTGYLDLYLIHALGVGDYGRDSVEWLKSDRLRHIARQLKDSGKVRLFGFSTHDTHYIRYLNSAAEGRVVDAILVQYNPFMPKSGDLDQALDACHAAGIGLIAMKEMRGLSSLPKRSPEMDALGLNNHQALLHVCWSDPRIASVCSEMSSETEIEENLAAARVFKAPMQQAAIDALKRTTAHCQAAVCANCDGRCQTAAGTRTAFNDIARYVAYYEESGRIAARDHYRALPDEARDATGADLMAAHRACLAHLDFHGILEKARRYFA